MTTRSTKQHQSQGKFEKKLAAYAVAGAAVLAPGAAQAGTITWVPVNTTVNQAEGGASYTFNLSGPTSADLTLLTGRYVVGSGPGEENKTSIGGAPSSRIYLSGANAADLAFGTVLNTLDPNWATAKTTNALLSGYFLDTNTTEGAWPTDGSAGYLGFSFNPGDGDHLGWAQIATTANATTSSFRVIDYAYGNTAGDDITVGQTPEPSTMALIAMGAAGLAALRRRRARNA